jgi:hypothetical protein
VHWQAFCLAKQASIRYTARKLSCGELNYRFGDADSDCTVDFGVARMNKIVVF